MVCYSFGLFFSGRKQRLPTRRWLQSRNSVEKKSWIATDFATDVTGLRVLGQGMLQNLQREKVEKMEKAMALFSFQYPPEV